MVLARRGSDYFCGLGETDRCANVWDSPLANAIQGATGLPVAGWGLVWSAVAFALPLWALVRRARRHSLEPIWSATLFTVLAGIATVLLLGGASFGAGEFCDTCVITYALVLAYAVVCLRASDRLRPAQIRGGALLAVSATVVAFLALLPPGLQTPRSSAAERSAFLEAAKRSLESEAKPGEAASRSMQAEEKPAEAASPSTRVEEKPVEVASRVVQPEEKPVEVASRVIQPEEKPVEVASRVVQPEEKPVEVASRVVQPEEKPVEAELRPDAARLDELISRLSPELRQDLSDAIAEYARSDRVPLRPARQLIGPSTAPVRITEFTDILCGHCAGFHETLAVLREMLPSDSFAIEPRQFPLDSECNAAVPMSSGDGIRCLAARAAICVEDDSMSFVDAMFDVQRWLTKEKIYQFASPFMSRERLEACVASPETDAKLQDDIAWALQLEIQGTPTVLLNGRPVPASLQFLYAMILAEADPGHPAFAALPRPQPRARRR
jgi:outer membrane biosynthesis protein TonB